MPGTELVPQNPNGTVTYLGLQITPIPRDVWEEGPGSRFSCHFLGSHATAEGRGILMGASRARWDCEPGTPSPLPRD